LRRHKLTPSLLPFGDYPCRWFASVMCSHVHKAILTSNSFLQSDGPRTYSNREAALGSIKNRSFDTYIIMSERLF
jgi:hypothetical protein